jgi:hypothetical protein
MSYGANQTQVRVFKEWRTSLDLSFHHFSASVFFTIATEFHSHRPGNMTARLFWAFELRKTRTSKIPPQYLDKQRASKVHIAFTSFNNTSNLTPSESLGLKLLAHTLHTCVDRLRMTVSPSLASPLHIPKSYRLHASFDIYQHDFNEAKLTRTW